MASDERWQDCPCGDGPRPGHPMGWCAEGRPKGWDPIGGPVVGGDYHGPHGPIPGTTTASDERAVVPERVFPDPVIVPLDELMRQFGVVPLATVKKALAAQGLHVVTDADMAVLEAMDKAEIRRAYDGYPYFSDTARPALEAELARREAKRCSG